MYVACYVKSLGPIDRKFHGHGENDGFVLYELGQSPWSMPMHVFSMAVGTICEWFKNYSLFLLRDVQLIRGGGGGGGFFLIKNFAVKTPKKNVLRWGPGKKK